MSAEELAAFLDGAHFDLGVDALATNTDLGYLQQPWEVPAEHLPLAAQHPALPAGDTLGPWAAELQLPGF